ncbi:sulfotransferase domain-containing protein [Thioalkalivibrio sp. ALJ24]|uniref:sulfotransferase domain-containing protein n=1 Tax=Thioalkalivibrio sp. ALJ24 TaxID=545276 RepID=UPI0018DC1E3F|nr:sulfotransferase domain-containing protein [Thioalkalivibrio sp. ALJ24]
MTDLVIHMGMPKTGTTTLQGNVFSQLPGFLGKEKQGRCLSGTREAAQGLTRLMERHFRNGMDESLRQELVRWRTDCMRLFQAQHTDRELSGPLILSEERLAMWPVNKGHVSKWPIQPGSRRSTVGNLPDRHHPAPFVAFLQAVREELWPDGRVKVLLTLRNQADWLASHYSHMSNRIPGACQRDFEARVKMLIRAPEPFLEWSAWVEQITATVGTDNTCVLPMELIGTRQYWEQLSEFLHLEQPIWRWESFASHPRNVRPKSAPDTWSLRPLNSKKLLSPLLGEGKRSAFEWTLKVIRRIEPCFRPLFSITIDRARDEKITLTPELRAQIKEAFHSGNTMLSHTLETDLSQLGY